MLKDTEQTRSCDGANQRDRRGPRHGPGYADGKQFQEHAHFQAIRAIAEEFKRPYGEVSAAYGELFVALAASAKVSNFLAVVVIRKIRERYRAPLL